MTILAYDTGPSNGAFNMGADEYALGVMDVPVFRFYSWYPYAVSIGRFQRIGEIDRAKCEALGVDIVRRMTGGKAVLHKNDLSYSFALGSGVLPASVEESYPSITRAIVYALAKLGLRARLHNGGNIVSQSGYACASDRMTGDVLVGEKKVAGSAQERRKGRVLQHGSIAISSDEDELAGLLAVSSFLRAKIEAGLPSSTLSAETGLHLDVESLKSLVLEGLAETFHAEIRIAHFDASETGIIEREYAATFRDPGWTNRM
jgi:lipoate-protein ligase A